MRFISLYVGVGDELWTKHRVHAQQCPSPPIQRKEVFNRDIWRRLILRAFPETSPGILNVGQKQGYLALDH